MKALLAALTLALGSAPLGAQGWTDRYDALILSHARQRGLNPRLVKAVIAAESEFVPQAVSKAGARGLMQVMPATAHLLGTPPERLHDPEANIGAGTAYLSVLYRTAWTRFSLEKLRYRDGPLWAQRRVLAAYHCGPRCLGEEARWPARTRAYVARVLQLYESPMSAVTAAEPEPSEEDEIQYELALRKRLRTGIRARGR